MPQPKKVLLVEDDGEVAAAVAEIFGQLGFDVVHLDDGRLGLEQGLASDFALVVLDIRLPSMDGLQICKCLRAARPSQPILMLTGESDEISTVLGLEFGADDNSCFSHHFCDVVVINFHQIVNYAVLRRLDSGAA